MFFYEKLRNIHYNLKAYNRPESIVRGFVFGFDRELGIKIGGFRTNILRGEDGSMALALKDYGKISFLKDNKCKPVTGLRALERDGSVFVAFKIRFIKELKNIKRYFYKKTKYECKD